MDEVASTPFPSGQHQFAANKPQENGNQEALQSSPPKTHKGPKTRELPSGPDAGQDRADTRLGKQD